MTNRDQAFHRSRAIIGASMTTLRAHPRLFAFPLLGFLAHSLYAGLWAALFGLRMDMVGLPPADFGLPASLLRDPQPSATIGPATGLLAYCGFQLIAVASAVALGHAALEALAGRPWSVQEAFRRVHARRRSIAGYAVIRATAGWVLRSRRRQGTSLVRKVGRLAWWAMTYLAIPVLAREDRTALGSIERSASLLGLTWKDTAVGRWSILWLWIPWAGLSLSPIVFGAGAGLEDDVLWFVLILVSASLFGFGGVVISTLDGIYRAALYVFATEGVVPKPFDDPDLHTLWVPATPKPDSVPQATVPGTDVANQPDAASQTNSPPACSDPAPPSDPEPPPAANPSDNDPSRDT